MTIDMNASLPASAGLSEKTRTVLQKAAGRADNIMFAAFVGGIAWAPLWLGSNRSIPWGFNAVFFGALLILYELFLVATDRRHPVAPLRIWFPALAFAIVCFWTLVQINPSLPVAYHHPIWQMTQEALGRDAPGAISVDVDKTVLALTRFSTCASVFWLALQFCRTGERAINLVRAIAIIGAAYAVYGIVQLYVFPTRMLWFDKTYYLDSLTSTFVNRNSYATYAGIGAVCALAVTMGIFLRSEGSRSASIGRRVAGLIALMLGQGGAWIASIFVIVIALVLTGSRAGVAASVAGIVALAILIGVRGRKNAVGVGAGLLAAGLAIGAALFNYGDFLADRLTVQGVESDARVATFALTWRSIADAPLFGFGDGAFQEVFAMYRDKSIGVAGVWDKAHNTYLEIFQGLGIPVSIIFLMGLAILIGRCGHAALTRKKNATAPLAAAAATVIVSLHAFLDFSLQIQAVALTWAALLGAGVAQSWSSRIITQK